MNFRIKIAAKLILSRLPVRYGFWKRLGLFEHGTMEKSDYAFSVFRSHFERSGLSGNREFACLEIGPGDSLASALVAKSFGATRTWLVDSGAFAGRDVKVYRAMGSFLTNKQMSVPPQPAFASLDTLLAACDARYRTKGVASLGEIPASSVDFIWSHAVLEHIRRRDFDSLCREMRRVLKPGGIASHRIDLRDHLGGALDNLRFKESLWEADWFANSGFYTNRLRYSEMMAAFTRAGFAVESIGREFWPNLPTPRSAMAPQFRDLPDEDLLISGFDVLLRDEHHTIHPSGP